MIYLHSASLDGDLKRKKFDSLESVFNSSLDVLLCDASPSTNRVGTDGILDIEAFYKLQFYFPEVAEHYAICFITDSVNALEGIFARRNQANYHKSQTCFAVDTRDSNVKMQINKMRQDRLAKGKNARLLWKKMQLNLTVHGAIRHGGVDTTVTSRKPPARSPMRYEESDSRSSPESEKAYEQVREGQSKKRKKKSALPRKDG